MSLRQDWWPMRKASVAIVILAAGKASRMGEGGKHKLLAEFDGVPLVRRSALTALGANAASVTVVVGHRRSEIEAALSARPTSLLRQICPCSMSMSAMQLASTSIRRTISWPPAAG
ncbi:nucleotidyltransferase family protein [Rhizobium leguminosarum]